MDIIIAGIIGAIIGYVVKDLILVNVTKGIKALCKKGYMLIKEGYTDTKKRYKKYRRRKNYLNTIKLIEKKKIAIPENFLRSRYKRDHPELHKIYEMIENGELEKPKGYMTDEQRDAMSETFKKLVAESKNYKNQMFSHQIKMVDPNKYINRD